MGRGKTKFALIWWTNTPFKDVIKLSQIPKKNQVQDAVTYLPWLDKVTGKTTKEPAKVIAISDNEDELNKKVLDTKGTLHDPNSTRSFSQETISNKKLIADQSNFIKSVQRSGSKQKEEEIRRADSIMGQNTFVTSTITSSNDTSSMTMSDSYNSNENNIQKFVRRDEYKMDSGSVIHYPYAPGTPRMIGNEKLDFMNHRPSTSNIQSSVVMLNDSYYVPHFEHQKYYHHPCNQYNYQSSTGPDLIGRNRYNSPLSSISMNTFNNLHPPSSQDPQDSPVQYPTNNYNANTCYERPNFQEILNNDGNELCDNHVEDNQSARNSKNNKFQDASLGILNDCKSDEASNASDKASDTSDEASDTSDEATDTSSATSNEERAQCRSTFLNGLIPMKVTKEIIQFHEAFLNTLKNIYAEQEKTNENGTVMIEIPAANLQKNSKNVEISKGCGFYLPESKYTYLKLNYERDQDWPETVRETLLEVYGDAIANYSATGKKSKRNAINTQLFKGLYQWINELSPLPIQKRAYVTCINKFAAYKRKYLRSKKKQTKKKTVEGKKKMQVKNSRIKKNKIEGKDNLQVNNSKIKKRKIKGKENLQINNSRIKKKKIEGKENLQTENSDQKKNNNAEYTLTEL